MKKQKKVLGVPLRKNVGSRASRAPLRSGRAKKRGPSPSARSRKKAIQEASVALYEKALDAVDHVGTANYSERQREARLWVHDAFDKLYRIIHRGFRGISALAARSGEPKAKSGASPTERKRATKGSGRSRATATPKKKVNTEETPRP